MLINKKLKASDKLLLQLYRAYLLSPDHPTKMRIIRWIESISFPKEGAVFEVDRDLKMYLHPDDQLEYRLLKNEQYEPLTIRFIEQNLFLDQTALFAGVNIGLHLIHASRCVSNNGCVIGVEPQPRSLYRAYKNIMLNELPQNIKLVSGALGNQSDLVPMSDAPEENSGWGSLVLRPPGPVPFYVHVDSVPNLLAKLGVSNLDFMLLDVEGCELDILQGFSLDCRPRTLIIEVHPYVLNAMKTTQHQVYKALNSLGYTCWTLDGREAYEIDEIPENNIVAVLETTKINFVEENTVCIKNN